MLRHLKMEFKRQEQLQQQQQMEQANVCPVQQPTTHLQPAVVPTNNQNKEAKQAGKDAKQVRRVRGRRSSKPMMEKRRRARINECLDTLKNYVLTDTNNLEKLGIDTTARENQNEETIARSILKSSGLINRHRGRKNPNKLEKADILELTVDYVRRLHEQRDQLMSINRSLSSNQQKYANKGSNISSPLSLNLSPIDKNLGCHRANIPTPPPSSASSSPQPLLSISSNIITHLSPPQPAVLQQINTYPATHDILDLSDSKRSRVNHQKFSADNQQNSNFLSAKSYYEDGVIYVQSLDGSWCPWNVLPQQA